MVLLSYALAHSRSFSASRAQNFLWWLLSRITLVVLHMGRFRQCHQILWPIVCLHTIDMMHVFVWAQVSAIRLFPDHAMFSHIAIFFRQVVIRQQEHYVAIRIQALLTLRSWFPRKDRAMTTSNIKQSVRRRGIPRRSVWVMLRYRLPTTACTNCVGRNPPLGIAASLLGQPRLLKMAIAVSRSPVFVVGLPGNFFTAPASA